ncbi:glycerol acyltransferase [Acinetobacter sp. Ver3]|nr:glycerol acyltransferase [Acinetobacter sp. Ver3]
MQIQHHSKMIRYGSLLQRFYFKPTFLGVEHLNADRPAMYVGNHTIYGVFDTPILIDYLYTEHKIKIVSLGDHIHFKIPYWKDMVHKMGAIEGLREYARDAMQQGYSILVFPGGGREVVKRKGEEYQLIWKERYGFLKLAQEFDYDIAPFVAVGGDEVFDLALDANYLLEKKWFKKLLTVPKIGKILRHGDVLPSIPKNIIPKRVPFYFKFLPRQSISNIKTEQDLIEFRDQLQQTIYENIASTQLIRDRQS